MTDSYGGYRVQLMETLAAQGIGDMAVLAAFAQVPRHLFVPEGLLHRAYEDTSLPIGNAQTISQPSTHARYLESLGLRGTERVLEVGTGSGYQTALLSFLTEQVVSVERITNLAEKARAAIRAAGCRNVSVVVGDGTLGWRSLGPYDCILVGAVGPTVPKPLLEQLTEGGRLIIPLEREERQGLFRITRRAGEFTEEKLGEARFVPLLGKHGFTSTDE